jgi:hypothetical protein
MPVLNTSYSDPMAATGGVQPYTWSATGLPLTLSIDRNTGAISGTPTSNGLYSVQVTVTDSQTPTAATASMTYSLVVGSGGSLGTISVNSPTIGQNLETPITISFSPALPADTSVVVTSSDPSNVLIGTSSSAGSGSVTATISAGTSSIFTYAQALGASGTYTVTVQAAGYANATSTVTLANSGFVVGGLNGIGGNFTTYEGVVTTLTVYSARLDNSGVFAENQALRGGLTASVPISSTTTTVGTVSAAQVAFTGGISSVTLNFTASQTTQGTTGIVLGTPSGFVQPSAGYLFTVTVQQSGIVPPVVTLGNNLQVQAKVSFTGPVTQSTQVTLTSSDQTKLQFCSTSTGTGLTSITFTVPVGYSATAPFFMRGFGSSGSVPYTISTTTLGSVNTAAVLAPSGLVMGTPGGTGSDFSMSVSYPSATITIYTYQLDPASGAAVQLQEVAGGQSVTVNVTSSNAAVGTISSSPVVISGGNSSNSTSFVPQGVGTAVVTASATGYGSTSQQATVTQSGMNITDGITIGQNLQEAGTIILGAPAPAAGLSVVLTADNSGLLQLAANPTDPGSKSITINVPGGTYIVNFYLYAVGSSGTAGYSVSAPGYNPASATAISFVPSGIVIFGPGNCISCNVSLAGGAQQMTIYTAQLTGDGLNTPVEPEALAGGVSLTVALQNSNANAGSVPGSVIISPNTSSTQVLFTPKQSGLSTTVSIVNPTGWTLPSMWTQVVFTVGQ